MPAFNTPRKAASNRKTDVDNIYNQLNLPGLTFKDQYVGSQVITISGRTIDGTVIHFLAIN